MATKRFSLYAKACTGYIMSARMMVIKSIFFTLLVPYLKDYVVTGRRNNRAPCYLLFFANEHLHPLIAIFSISYANMCQIFVHNIFSVTWTVQPAINDLLW